jgi:hypothetical protein
MSGNKACSHMLTISKMEKNGIPKERQKRQIENVTGPV